jgi:hypothetical protein
MPVLCLVFLIHYNEALALVERFEFYYTPKSASWLNMIEIKFWALSRKYLNQRIPTSIPQFRISVTTVSLPNIAHF